MFDHLKRTLAAVNPFHRSENVMLDYINRIYPENHK